ncbi:MAG: helix-turn-helix domain-containing protein [Thermosynechococcaceae cyanobacterium]
MPLNFDELWELLSIQDESQLIEAKKGSEVGKSCWETISAFANEPGIGGGYLMLGIQSPRDSPTGVYEIVGVKDPDKVQLDLTSQCNTVFNIPQRPQIYLETKERKTVVIVYVSEASPTVKPIYIAKQGLPKGAFRRISSADIKCTDEDIELLYQDRQNQSYDTAPIHEASLDDLDPAAIKAYRQAREKLNLNAGTNLRRDSLPRMDFSFCLIE